MKNKKDKIKNNLHNIKEILKNPRYRAILGLVFYFIFFFIIITSLRSNYSKKDLKKVDHTGTFEFSIEQIKDKNYHYIYQINNTTYEGDKYYEKERFTKNELESFYKNEDTYFKENNGVWVKTDNPYLYYNLLDINQLEKILKQAYYEFKTEYHDANIIYCYKISTNNLVQILDNQSIDIADIPNTINIITNNLKEVVEIRLDLNSYSQYKFHQNELNITLKYSQFGEVKPINNP